MGNDLIAGRSQLLRYSLPEMFMIVTAGRNETGVAFSNSYGYIVIRETGLLLCHFQKHRDPVRTLVWQLSFLSNVLRTPPTTKPTIGVITLAL